MAMTDIMPDTDKLSKDETGLPPHILNPQPLLVVISGPSGVGKDATLIRMRERGYPFHFVVTMTTRPPRPGETHGVDYFFISEEEYDRLLAADEFLEHATVYGYRYGVPKRQVREAWARGQDVLMRVDVQGATTIKKLVPEAVFIFLVAPSLDELMQRLKDRATEREEDLERRMATARAEMKRLPEFDYVVVNPQGHLDDAVERIMAIIQAEKCRVRPRKINL
jgi:guanylate kinase